MNKIIVLLGCLAIMAAVVHAQSFSSGSTGADGALDLSTMICPANVCTVQIPESGILNYTTVNVPSGRILQFRANLRNTTITLLAQGSVTIADIVSVSAKDGTNYYIPGPGGFYGGDANNGAGFGPGAGTFDGHREGQWVGPLSLSPIVGGSGGCGLCTAFNGCHTGGGGGGAITIASSTSITVSSTGEVRAIGGGDPANYGGPGSGGAIRLVANSVNVSGTLRATGANLYGNYAGGNGVIRLEAPQGSLSFTGNATPAAGLFPINPTVVPSASPSLIIASIGGFPVPSYAGQRFDTYDMLLPNQLADPISVVIHANNIPVGTQVTVGVVNGSPSATSTPGTLSGTFASSSATASISNLNRGAVTYLLATATFDPPLSAMQFNLKGPNFVAKVQLIASPGAKPKFNFLSPDGSQIDIAKLPKRFLQQLGL